MLDGDIMKFREHFNGAAAFSRSRFRGDGVLGTEVSRDSFLRDVAVALRFEGGSLEQMVASFLYDLLEVADDANEQLAQEIEYHFNSEVRAIVETCTMPGGDAPLTERRSQFLARLRSLEDGHPALLVYQVATNTKLKLIYNCWSSSGQAILRALPGRSPRAKLRWYCELAIFFRGRMPGRTTDEFSRYAQGLINKVSDVDVPIDAVPAFPFLQRELYSALGDRLRFPVGRNIGAGIKTRSGAYVPVNRFDRIEVKSRHGVIPYTWIEPEKSQLRMMICIKAVYSGSALTNERAIERRLSEAIREVVDGLKMRCAEARFEILSGWDDEAIDTSVGLKIGLDYDGTRELVEGLEWIHRGGFGLDVDKVGLLEISVR